MFEWLRNLFSGGDRLDFYKPRQRYIYRYKDGDRVVIADPIALFKAVMEVGPTLEIDLRVAGSISKDASKGHTTAVAKLRQVFNLRSFAEGGATDVEVVELFNHFMVYAESLKKNSPTSATSATATSPTSVPSSAASPATPNSSVSGSIANGHSTVPPVPSPTELALPTAPSTQESLTSEH